VLTDEEKSVYIRKAEEYRILRRKNCGEIAKHKIEISKLEKELNDSMPKTPKGVRLCETCGVMSVKYVGRESSNPKSQHVYVCEICDKKILSSV
jgi:hypothetical protein